MSQMKAIGGKIRGNIGVHIAHFLLINHTNQASHRIHSWLIILSMQIHNLGNDRFVEGRDVQPRWQVGYGNNN